MKARMRLMITLFLLLLLLPGCGIVGGKHDVIRSYVLEIEREGEREVFPLASETSNLPRLLLGIPGAAPGFESSRMAYVQIPHEVNYFSKSQWVETPAKMLTPLLVQSLEARGMWQSVIAMPTSIRGDYRLDLTHVVLVQEFLRYPSQLRLGWRGQLIHLQDRQIIGTKMFTVEEEALSEDAYGGVLAAQQAVNKLLNDLNEWLSGCLQEQSLGFC